MRNQLFKDLGGYELIGMFCSEVNERADWYTFRKDIDYKCMLIDRETGEVYHSNNYIN